MSQTIYASINPLTTSGNELATILTDFKEAMVSGMSGTTRPTELDPGGSWIDTATADTYIFKVWTGTVDVEIFRINLLTGAAGVTGAIDSFAILKTSADTVSPALDFIKKRIANDGQVLIGDYIGTINFKGDDNAGATPTSCRIRVVATNNFTGVATGADLVFETTSAGSASISEAMRLKDGLLGIGTAAPENSLHVKGTGIRNEKVSADAVGAIDIFRKKRIASLGKVLSGDVIGESRYHSTDEAGAEITNVGRVEVKATQDHTTTQQGTQMAWSVKKTGATSETEQMVLADNWTLKTNAIFQKMLTLEQQVDSTTTGADQSVTPTKANLKVTHASLASINNISPANGKFVILINGVGASITIKHNTGGTAANRIFVPSGVDLSLSDGASLFFLYDDASSLWRIVGGSGSGGGATTQGTRQTGVSISAGTAISPTPNLESLVFVVGNGGAVVVTASPPVVVSGMVIGQKLKIVGTSDTNTVQYDNHNNLVLTRGSAVLGKDQAIELQYMGSDGTNASWVETGRNF